MKFVVAIAYQAAKIMWLFQITFSMSIKTVGQNKYDLKLALSMIGRRDLELFIVCG